MIDACCVYVVASLSEYRLHDEFLQCLLGGLRQQQQREQLEWRVLRILWAADRLMLPYDQIRQSSSFRAKSVSTTEGEQFLPDEKER